MDLKSKHAARRTESPEERGDMEGIVDHSEVKKTLMLKSQSEQKIFKGFTMRQASPDKPHLKKDFVI